MEKVTRKPTFCTDGELLTYLRYLDELRISGVTNMFGAGKYLENAFLFNQDEAGQVLSYWMATFSERHPK